jgi:hypothetical protein
MAGWQPSPYRTECACVRLTICYPAEESLQYESCCGGFLAERPRDRALISMMVYSFARVGATITMKVGNYFQHEESDDRPSLKRRHVGTAQLGGCGYELPASILNPTVREKLERKVLNVAPGQIATRLVAFFHDCGPGRTHFCQS